jgi:hypothetical protein
MGLLGVSAACGPAPESPPQAVSWGASSSSGWSGNSSSSAAAGLSSPLVVVVDADRTLTATPGQGVGVFTEYRSGGHWHVWWTCDSSVTHSPCGFEVSASAVGGQISNVQPEGTASESVAIASPAKVTVSTITTTGLDGVTFDTAPGETIEVDAQLNSVRDGHFLFFVQDGVVNGGYTGTLSDPLMLSPSEP